MSTNYVYGTGRRKTAVARVRLLPGDGQLVVNAGQVKVSGNKLVQKRYYRHSN